MVNPYVPNIKNLPLELHRSIEIDFKCGRIKQTDMLILWHLSKNMKKVFDFSPSFKDLSHIADTPYEFIVTVGDMQFGVAFGENSYNTDRIIHLIRHG
jgi:hypothetical protein